MEVPPVTSPHTELVATGRRHLAVRDYNAAVETLASACEAIAGEHGETADQCAEVYLWYGKALLGISREESGVLGDGVPGANADEEDDDEEENDVENGDAAAGTNGDAEPVKHNVDADSVKQDKEPEAGKDNGTAEAPKLEEQEKPATTEEPASSEKPASNPEKNGDVAENGDPKDDSAVNMEEDDDNCDNLQLAWEMLDLSRSILYRRVQDGGGDAARALLADAHLSLGEVALESETYDKAIIDMQSCLDIQKELYRSDDRRIAETHYQIGLANSLASNFEDAITHFKNAANILETRIKTLESPTANGDATVKKFTLTDPQHSIETEIKELKELLPEIKEKIQDMMEYKAETAKRIREALMGGDGDPSISSSSAPSSAAFGSGSKAVGSSSAAFGSSSKAFGSSSAAFGSSSAAFGSSSAAFGSSSAAFGSSSAAFGSSSAGFSSSSGSSSADAGSSKPAADISHLIKRKRKASEEDKDATPPPKKTTT